MAVVKDSTLRYLEFIQREDRVRHHTYVQEMRQYDLMKAGDPEAIRESVRMWDSGLYGHVSDDPVRNAKYLFVTSIALVTRFAIEGGMDEEDAYNASDLYIQDMDHCDSVDAVRRLHTDMMTFFTWAMADLAKQDVQSRPIAEVLDYIHYHLHEKITVSTLAEHVHLNPTYLSELFGKDGNVDLALHHRSACGGRGQHAQILPVLPRRDRADPRVPVPEPFHQGVQTGHRHDAEGIPRHLRENGHLAAVGPVPPGALP